MPTPDQELLFAHSRASLGDGERFPLRPPGAVLELEPRGFRYAPKRTRREPALVPLEEVTHVAVASRVLWIGTRRSVFLIRRNLFVDPADAERFARALLAAIARQPHGAIQLTRMAQVEHFLRHPFPRRATACVAALCIAVFGLQLADPFFEEIGSFVPGLVAQGEWWRAVTANFVHGLVVFPLHLAMNLLGLLGFAFLVERPLGPARTAVVMGASVVGAMGASALAGYREVIGASGIVAGLVGATLCLELHHADRLPAFWRLPRRLFVIALVAEGILGFAVPIIAGAAHLGGFVAGYGATRLLADRTLSESPARTETRVLAAGFALVVVLAFAAAAPLALRQPAAMDRHARHLLSLAVVDPWRLNNLAWRMATETGAAPEQLESALALARRAVVETDAENPDLLDTLAEVHFARHETDEALDAIERAIALAPEDAYFREQRRRFLGERAPDDRPAPPGLPWPFRDREEGGGFAAEEPGVEI